MGALEILIWLGVILAGLIVLSVVAFLAVLIWAAAVGLRRMRDDEENDEKSIFKSGGQS